MSAASSVKPPDGRYQVDFTIHTAKFYADSLGNQHPADPTHDALPVAIFPALGKSKMPFLPLLLVKRRLHPGENHLQYVVAQKPASVAADPYHLVIDRQLSDNAKRL